MDEIKETKNIKNIIEERIKDYNLAIEYFKSNELTKQLKKAEEDLKELKKAKDKLLSGNTKEIEENKLPKEITPEYIYGYSSEERLKKFHQIISEMIIQKKRLQTDLENKINELKKLTKNQLILIKDEIEKEFRNIKENKDKYNQIINLLQEEFKNKWVPAPLFSENLEDSKIEIINEDIPENTLRVTLGKTDYKKNRNIYLLNKIKDYKYEQKVYQKDIGDWTNVFDFVLTEKEYYDLSDKTFHFDIFEIVKNKNKHKGTCDVSLNYLKQKIEYSAKFPLDLETKRFVPNIEINFKIRKCKEPSYETFQKRIYCFTKFYPPFK